MNRNYSDYNILISVVTSGIPTDYAGILEEDGKTISLKYPMEHGYTSQGVSGSVRWRR